MSLLKAQLEERPPESHVVHTDAPSSDARSSARTAEIFRVKNGKIAAMQDAGAVEEPLEIQLAYGPIDDRRVKSISITMRTPGDDDELAADFLMMEGVVRDSTHHTSLQAAVSAERRLSRVLRTLCRCHSTITS